MLVRRWLPPLILVLALVATPVLGGEFFAYQIALFLIYGIATQGVALCWGRLGFLPLGHALFFGLGAYLAGAALKAGESEPLWLLGLLGALVLPAVLAWGIARLIFARNQSSGPYFSLITLAMTMLGFLAAQQWSSVTGGFNGMVDIPEWAFFDRYGRFYWLVAAAVLTSTLIVSLLIRRPMGVLWDGIAQNEDRMQLFGYATDRIKAKAYALSAMLAALAGMLFALHQGIVTPQAMGFVLSTEFVIWAAVGGKTSPYGAVLGAVLIGYVSAELRDSFVYWEVFVALIFIAVVRFMPTGLVGWLAGLFAPPVLSAEPGGIAAPAPPARAQVPSLHFKGVEVQRSGVRILNGLSFSLKGPGIRAVIGPNGAGKTSAFNVMTGRLPVRSGSIWVNGRNMTGRPAWQVARQGVGRKLQIPSVFPALSVGLNIAIALWAGRLSGLDTVRRSPLAWHSALLDELLRRFPELLTHWNSPAGSLSQGQRQALELVMTLLPEPDLLLLDEPCAGLSPAETRRMITAICEVVAQLGAAALLIEHDLTAVAEIGGDVYVLHQGTLLAQGSLAEMQADPAVRSVYAGARK